MASFIPPLYIGTSWWTYYNLPETMDVGNSNEIGERNSMHNEAYVYVNLWNGPTSHLTNGWNECLLMTAHVDLYAKKYVKAECLIFGSAFSLSSV